MKHYDYDSIKNFAQREVITNISDMAEHLFSWEGDKYANWDEWENLYVTRCPECGEIVDEWKEVDENDIVHIEPDDIANEYMDHGVKCPHCSAIHNEKPEAEPQEIYEYWIVSPWLGRKLRDKRGTSVRTLGRLDMGQDLHRSIDCTRQCYICNML